MRNTLTTAALALGLVAIGGAWVHFHAATAPPRFTVLPVTRGDITQKVNATGVVTAPTAVDVGSEVSGTIVSIGADFNSVVHKGQVLARINPSAFETQVAAATADLARTAADADVAREAVEDAHEQDERSHELAAKQLVTQADLDQADVDLKEAQAQLASAEAAVAKAKGALDQARVDLAHTVITSPVDGIVLDRKVDVGQTVAAGFQAPSLFSVAADLGRIEVMADVDEADIGGVRVGEVARFRVDAYPNHEFVGTVSQVRLQPTADLMAVTYKVVVNVDNPELLLRPGMSATVGIETARHEQVLRVPTQAFRFRPTLDLLGVLGEHSLDKSVTRVPSFVAPGMRLELWVARNGHLEPRLVTVGIGDGVSTEVGDGLTEGTMVTLSASLPQKPR
jgi:HlyD family secretion protein